MNTCVPGIDYERTVLVSSTTGTGSDINDYVYTRIQTMPCLNHDYVNTYEELCPGFRPCALHILTACVLQHTSQLRTTAQRATTAKPRYVASLVV